MLKSLRIESRGYGFQAEVLVKALAPDAHRIVEVPMDLIERKHGESKAFRVKNFVDVARTLRLLASLECDRVRADAARRAGRRAMIESSHATVPPAGKIVRVDELPAIRERFRDRTIVLCHGAFDLVHMGHLIHFEEARVARATCSW